MTAILNGHIGRCLGALAGVSRIAGNVRRAAVAFGRDRSGATAIEYGMIAALIALGMLAGLQDASQAVVDTYQYILDQYKVANTA